MDITKIIAPVGPYLSHHLSYQPKCVVARRHLIILPYYLMVISTLALPTCSFISPHESGLPCHSPNHVSSFHCIALPCEITAHGPKAVRGNRLPVIPPSSLCVNYPTYSTPNHHQICLMVIQWIPLNPNPPFKFLPNNPSNHILVVYLYHLMTMFGSYLLVDFQCNFHDLACPTLPRDEGDHPPATFTLILHPPTLNTTWPRTRRMILEQFNDSNSYWKL